MKLKEKYKNLVDKANEAMARFEFDPDSQAVKVATAVAIGVGVTAFAGVAVAAAFGGFVLFHERGALKAALNGKPARPKPLSPDLWVRAFEPEEGRLKGGGEKVIGRVRKGGCDPSVRGEVWPFLLGLYDPNSTEVEREEHRGKRREKYMELRRQAKEVGKKAQQEEDRRTALQRREELAAAKARRERKSAEEAEARRAEEANAADTETQPLLSSASPVQEGPARGEGERAEARSRLSPSGSASAGCQAEGAEGERSGGAERGGKEGREAAKEQSKEPAEIDLSPPDEPDGGQFLADYATWRRIMRLDAVRMNAAWIPYSSQAPTPADEAARLAAEVGLIEDAHLEPSRRNHAARLVAILEAYALHDPEIGYCQGMSDLLSPFVALIDDDSEAFWCFESFMGKARQNFRVDEIGIRKQLDTVALILREGDPELYEHLRRTGAEDCIFVYRMVVVLLRRELSFEQTLGLWEVVWADAAAAAAADAAALSAAAAGGTVIKRTSDARAGASTELLLFVVAAIIRQNRREILTCQAVDEILRLCTSWAGKLDVWPLIDEARSLVAKLHGLV